MRGMANTKQVERLEATVTDLTAKLAAATRIGRTRAPAPWSLPKRPKRGAPARRASGLMLWSDWHIEERTRERGADGRLISRHGVAESRVKAQQIVEAAIAVGERHGLGGRYTLDHMSIGLIGDFITGHLHDDNVEACELPPTDAAFEAAELLARSLTTYVQNTPARTIRIVTRPGNHGRTTHRMRVSTAPGHSWEQLVYLTLRQRLAGLRTRTGQPLEWVVEDGIMTYTREPLGLVRWVHGHEISYQGGVGGLVIPVAKRVARWNAARGEHADLTVLGHFHQLEWLTGPPGILVNGSLIGVSSYGRSLGFGSQEPAQAHLVYSEHHRQIFALDRLCAVPVPDVPGD